MSFLLRFVLPAGCWVLVGFSFLVVMLASWEGERVSGSFYMCLGIAVFVSLVALLRQVVRYSLLLGGDIR